MSKTHLIIPDPHAHYKHNNSRAILAGKLILDVKPDVVICIGDLADMPSMSGYDRGKKSFQGRTYLSDIQSAVDFNVLLWDTVRAAKKRLPYRVILEGNHENRIKKALDLQPELEGAVCFDDLEFHSFYDDIIEYDGNVPGHIEIDGISYAHFLVSGIAGRPIGGEHIGHSLITKRLSSSVVGHNHLLDMCQRTDNLGKRVIGLSCGCFIDYKMDWPGKTQDLWWSGLVILRNVSNGSFDIECISMDRLKKEYNDAFN